MTRGIRKGCCKGQRKLVRGTRINAQVGGLWGSTMDTCPRFSTDSVSKPSLPCSHGLFPAVQKSTPVHCVYVVNWNALDKEQLRWFCSASERVPTGSRKRQAPRRKRALRFQVSTAPAQILLFPLQVFPAVLLLYWHGPSWSWGLLLKTCRSYKIIKVL